MPQPATEPSADRREFYDRLGRHHLSPLWLSLATLVPRQPASGCRPAIWRYPELRSLLLEAGGLVSVEEAERRVLVLENPAFGGQSRITTSLYAGLQLVLPGERARGHRHTQSALRFVLEGTGAYTAVDGERATMHPGDFIITPSWQWHDHGNDTDDPVVWLDGLDIPLVQALDAGFAEPMHAVEQAVTRPAGDSLARFGANLLPVDHRPRGLASPVFSYPYDRTREALETLGRNGEPDPCHGHKMRFVNPVTGGFAMPTIGTFMQLLPRGFETKPYRSTDATVFTPVEGEGRTHVGAAVLEWRARDVFVVPSWATVRHQAASDAVLFSFSDRPVQQATGLFREERLP
ncbi:MAG: gentisate 1,2-dioxygenase [Steroidobacteraceae bacterium]|jgi:gentisate 1,2-dioxygenase|nr:gentisate 1,2-dioxygenase [Steroidobacteraceae bacterium]